MRFDEARDGVEDPLGAVGLLLTPERKTLGKVFVAGSADIGLGELCVSGRRTRTSTCARHAESRVGGPRRIESIVCSVLCLRVLLEMP